LGEIDRARAIYSHCSEICDPRVHPQFWETWKEFEVKHGNEDTVREMLRIKRSVQATYRPNVNFMTAQMLATGGAPHNVGELTAGDSMALLEARAQRMAAEQELGIRTRPPAIKLTTGGGSNIAFVRGESRQTLKATTENPDEIALEDEDEDEEDSDQGDQQTTERDSRVEVEIVQQTVPSGVFGGLSKTKEEE